MERFVHLSLKTTAVPVCNWPSWMMQVGNACHPTKLLDLSLVCPYMDRYMPDTGQRIWGQCDVRKGQLIWALAYLIWKCMPHPVMSVHFMPINGVICQAHPNLESEHHCDQPAPYKDI